MQEDVSEMASLRAQQQAMKAQMAAMQQAEQAMEDLVIPMPPNTSPDNAASEGPIEIVPLPEPSTPDLSREATYVAGQPSAFPGLVTAHAKATGRGRLR